MITKLVFAIVATLLLLPAPGPVLRFNAEDVWSISAQTYNAADRHDLIEEDGVTCDVSRRPEARPCGIDIAAVAMHMLMLQGQPTNVWPADVNWQSYDWRHDEAQATTDIQLAVEIWTDAPAGSRMYWMACSIIPSEPDVSICAGVDRLDHFNYYRIPSVDILALADYFDAGEFPVR